MEGRTYLGKVKPLEPETGLRFMFVTFAEDYVGIKSTTTPVEEDGIRAMMREMGVPEPMINSHIAKAPFVAY